jgi:predicted nucleotidyltransferase
MKHPTEDERLLSPDEIREGMRLAMAKAGCRGKVILFGGYSRGDYLTDIGIMVVVDEYKKNQIKDIDDLRHCIDLDRGIALVVVIAEIYEIQKTWCATACYDAEEYGVFLFDNRDEP